MRTFSVDEAFEILNQNKITRHKESLRRWLRQGVIKGIVPTSKKDGWRIQEDILDDFIRSRMPESYATNVAEKNNATNDTIDNIKEQTRSEMWLELAKRGIWEGYIEVKKTLIKECVQHRKYPLDLVEKVWKACEGNSRAFKKPRVNYLLEAFAFDGNRMMMDKSFESIEEQIVFPIIEYTRTKV